MHSSTLSREQSSKDSDAAGQTKKDKKSRPHARQKTLDSLVTESDFNTKESMRSRPNKRRDLNAEVEGDDSDLERASSESLKNIKIAKPEAY